MNPELLPATLVPAPIERYEVTQGLDGRHGRLRAPRELNQLQADTDRDAINTWLARYPEGSPTFVAYRKEAERLLLWATLRQGKAMSDLGVEDFQAYERFLLDPQPASEWIAGYDEFGRAPKNPLKLPRSSPDWRPFAGALSPASQRYALQVLRILFTWLRDAGYLSSNPLALLRSPRKQQAVRVERYLPEPHWQAVLSAIKGMRTQTNEEVSVAARARWACVLLYGTGMRIAELAAATMGSISPVLGADGRTRWRLKIVGKGGKEREIPFTGDLMSELARYRKAIGLEEMPPAGDTTPLIRPTRGPVRPMSRRALHSALKQTFETAAAAVRARGPEFEDAARHIEAASAHWLRHSAGTVWANAIGLKAAQANLGHSQLNTTGIYLHDEFEKRFDAMEEQSKGKPTG